jgi:hypothetical protein
MELEVKVNREILRGAVSQVIFCQACQGILDVKDTVLCIATWAAGGTTRVVIHASHWDATVRENVESMMTKGNITGHEVYDGRELFGRKRKVQVK